VTTTKLTTLLPAAHLGSAWPHVSRWYDAKHQGTALGVFEAAATQDAGRDVRTEASMIKVFAAEMASRVIDRAMQTFGALGMTKETPLQLMAQEVRTMRVYEGSTKVHRMVVARRQLAQGR